MIIRMIIEMMMIINGNEIDNDDKDDGDVE